MPGYFALLLHAHLPFVRHPEHERFLEESWLFEAVAETYLPLLRLLEGWAKDDMQVRLTMSLSPTLCSMLRDPLLQDRCQRHLRGLVELAEKEIHRNHWDGRARRLSELYLDRFIALEQQYLGCGRDVVEAFSRQQQSGRLEILTCAATHGLLPLLASQPASLRAQILTARDHYRGCFGQDPQGIWLPECAYAEAVEPALREAGLRWFVVDGHGVLHARPRPRYGVYAPVLTREGLLVFARDLESAKQVWSRHEGYPGDARYRDFYRDIGFDLDLDYIGPYLPSPDLRGFTGIKYYRITGPSPHKALYDPELAHQAADEHAHQFLQSRVEQVRRMAGLMDRPPLIVAPYDAELFGHWWYEGPEFLDLFVRKAYYDQQEFSFLTLGDYAALPAPVQVAQPSPSSWGEEGYLRVWLNETNEWIYPHLQVASERMAQLARRFPEASGLTLRALQQAGRELLLAQSSDWPFILRTGTCPDYARDRVRSHLLRFLKLHEQLEADRIDEAWLAKVEAADNLFPELRYRYWA
jgi:1,4-alpha-glucan branching enzyme